MSKELAGDTRPAFNVKIKLSQARLDRLNALLVQAEVSRTELFEKFIDDILENKIIVVNKGIIIYEAPIAQR